VVGFVTGEPGLKIIDAYNHLWKARPNAPETFMHTGLGPAELVAELDNKGIDMAVVCPLGQDPDNAYIAESVQAYPTRLLGFCEANPRDPAAPEIIQNAVEVLGLKGYKLHPQMQGHTPSSHALMDPVMQTCADLGIPVYAHCLDDMWVTPFQYEEMIRPFSTVPLILGHMGFMWLSDEAMLVAERNPNVYLETSFTSLSNQRNAICRVGPERVLMGTDWPHNDYDLQMEMARRAAGSQEAFELVAGGNLVRLLKLG
jgi:predicted TIM-barrel fold metal-dependent hydrolase